MRAHRRTRHTRYARRRRWRVNDVVRLRFRKWVRREVPAQRKPNQQTSQAPQAVRTQRGAAHQGLIFHESNMTISKLRCAVSCLWCRRSKSSSVMTTSVPPLGGGGGTAAGGAGSGAAWARGRPGRRFFGGDSTAGSRIVHAASLTHSSMRLSMST